MKGAHLIPKNEMEGKPQGLTGAEVTDVNYDPIINMTYYWCCVDFLFFIATY